MKRLAGLLVLLVSFTAKAQVYDINLSFSKCPWKGNNAFLDSVLQRYPDKDKIYYKVPLTFWVYTDQKGFGGTAVEIKDQVNQLNYFFNTLNHTGILFYVAQINFIRKPKHTDVGYITENFILTATNHLPGTVNIHLVKSITLNLLMKDYEFGGTYNSLTHSIIMGRSDFPTGLSHEMGHYFGLLHPHRNWNKGKLLAESVSRTRTVGNGHKRNCEVRGDYLCDTPAEPNMFDYTDDNCQYTGKEKDPWGQPYTPSTHNIMSYLHNKRCRKKFTDMQKAVMLYNIEHSKYASGWANTPEHFSIAPDKYEPDDYYKTGTLLLPDSTQYHTFNQIYTKKGLLTNTIDFFRIAKTTNGRYYLKILRGKYAFPVIRLNLYDKTQLPSPQSMAPKPQPIFSTVISEPGAVLLPMDNQDIYYLELILENTSSKPVLYDYRVRLEFFE